MLKRLTACLLVAGVLGAGLATSHQPADAGRAPAPAGQHR
jgi:hypothetical protein